MALAKRSSMVISSKEINSGAIFFKWLEFRYFKSRLICFRYKCTQDIGFGININK